MQDYFYSLSDQLFKHLQTDEQLLLSFSAEDSDFVRLNKNKIRQAGGVSQRQISLDLIQDKRHAQAWIDLAGDSSQDLSKLTDILKKLREQRSFLNEDPYFTYADKINNTEYHHDTEVINSQQAVEQIIQAADGLDLVGIFANGIQYSGFANSLGQRNWHSSANFNFDWSCYHAEDKAVKANYAGFDWQQNSLRNKIESVKHQLNTLKKPAITIKPGQYRVYLAPAALKEIIGLMSWGGFGLKAQRSKTSPLIQMIEKDRNLSSQFSLREYHARGLAPCFTSNGFIKPEQVQLIEQGYYKDSLISSRSAIEFNSQSNAESEFPGALDLSAGDLSNKNILNELDTGLYINNLWYLNFSDRSACQLTGMTRFACFWVENGEIQAPLNVMRFDDNVYDMLGTNLLKLTQQRDFIFDASSYGHRSTNSIELPGALIDNMRFTL